MYERLKNFFDFQVPMLTPKPSAYAIEDLPGLWRLHWQVGDRVLFSSFYTRHDQACLLWSAISAVIFGIAQFWTVSWTTQAICWSLLTAIGSIGTVILTDRWVRPAGLRWLLYTWIGLMILGMGITDLSVFWGWGSVLLNLCPLWLALNAIGYWMTAWAMQSRAFLLVGVWHLLGIGVLSWVGRWQLLATGIVIGLSVFLIAELQWDSNGDCVNHPPESQPETELGGSELPA